MKYIHLAEHSDPPILSNVGPFKAVVVINETVDRQWQYRISRWLVDSGCYYMLAWGIDCSSWDDSVDLANLERFEYGDIPDEKSVMTTWHENDPLAHVFWCCEHLASHDHEAWTETLIIDIAKESREAEIIRLFQAAQHGDDSPPAQLFG